MAISPELCPWSVPVQLEAGRFVALLPEHAALNVRTAPLPAYGSDVERCASDQLLYADLQTVLYSHVAGRLGSGRAGFYRDWYLKGVGRTPLAANWNRGDHLHSSGHLAASSAIREYVASLYLREQGLVTSIVPCDGVLFAELDPSLRGYHGNLYGAVPDDNVPPVDRSLQAISVKPGGFARQSNFVWLLHHLTPASIEQGNTSLGVFCDLLAAALAPASLPAGDALAPSPMTPDQLARMLSLAIHSAFQQFRLWFERGIWWGSFGNNFTIDGRFLDLETPAIIGGPLVGRWSVTDGDSIGAQHAASIIPFEQLAFVAQSQAFCSELVRVLARLPRHFHPIEREFAAELAREIDAQILASDQVLGASDRVHDRIIDMIEGVFGRLPRGDHAALHRLLAAVSGDEAADDPLDDAEAMRGSPVPGFPGLIIEPGSRVRPLAVTLASGRRLGPSEEQVRNARRWADVIADLDQTTSLVRVLDTLAALRAEVSSATSTAPNTGSAT